MKSLFAVFLTVLLLLGSGCSSTVPIKQTFPSLPDELIKSCKPLELIDNSTTTLSKLMETVTKNYGLRHECAAQLDAILEWYTKQKKIFDEVK